MEMTLPIPPTTDDRPIWDVFLSSLWQPSLTVADELGVFDALDKHPATPRQLADSLQCNERGITALLVMLASLGFLVSHDGSYAVSDVARNFLLHNARFYWGGAFGNCDTDPVHVAIREAIRSPTQPIGESSAAEMIEAWESGSLDLQQARDTARKMHGHSHPAAMGVAHHGGFEGVSRLLDVGGGSGCFATALAQRYPHLRCTVMELPAMCPITQEYIAAAGVEDRVDTYAADMFREAWPGGYDAILFSNIFHDWGVDQCANLAAMAHSVLPVGGRICVHEMLLDDGGTGPRTVAAFSMLMLIATRGGQFTLGQLKAILEGAGFGEVVVRHTYGYHSVVTAIKG